MTSLVVEERPRLGAATGYRCIQHGGCPQATPSELLPALGLIGQRLVLQEATRGEGFRREGTSRRTKALSVSQLLPTTWKARVMAIRTTLNVSLSVELGEFIKDQIATGRYGTASEVVRAALRLLQERESANGQMTRQSSQQAAS